MRLSSRMASLAPEGAFAVLAAAQELERSGRSIIHFEIGQPDFTTPSFIAEAGIDAIRSGRTRYTPSLGIRSLREAIAEHVSTTHGVSLSFESVAVTPSAKTALFTAMAALVDPGDEVIVPDPGFPFYGIMPGFFGARARPLPLQEEQGFRFNRKAFLKLFSKKTKLIILNSPSNPTGSMLPTEDLAFIASVVDGTQCWILSDEIYRELVYTGTPCPSIYSLPKMSKRVILVDGFSKSCAMTGWRLGYMIAPVDIMEKIDYLLTHMVACTASFTQEAGLAALNGVWKRTVAPMVASYKMRRDALISMLNTLPGIKTLIPDGAFYVFPNIAGTGMNSASFVRKMLDEAGVALLPGTAFGRHGEGYVRICYATSMDNIREGIKKMQRVLS